jgi:uncharacterized RDD family membrane protein YckC
MLRADVAGRVPPTSRTAVARPGRPLFRLAAYVVDWLVMVILSSTLVSVAGLQLYLATDRSRSEPPDTAIYTFLVLVALAAPLWFLMTLTGWAWYGRSIGKLAMGLRIVNGRGEPPGVVRGIVRIAVALVENLAILIGLATLGAWLALGPIVPQWALPAAGALVLLGVAAQLPAVLGGEGRALHDRAAGTRVIEE